MGMDADTYERLKHQKDRQALRRSEKDRRKGSKFDLNLPNQLTLLRVVLILPFVLFMLIGRCEGASRIFALLIFVAASITDALDGYIARKEGLITNFGKFMDPLADKVLVLSAMICLVSLDRLAAWVVILIIAREFAISGFRLVAATNDVVIAASIFGKIKTVTQMVAVILLILDTGSGALHIVTQIAVYLCVVMTVVSLVEYMYKNRQLLVME